MPGSKVTVHAVFRGNPAGKRAAAPDLCENRRVHFPLGFEQYGKASFPDCCGKGATTVNRFHWEVGMPGSKVTVQAVFRGNPAGKRAAVPGLCENKRVHLPPGFRAVVPGLLLSVLW